MTKAKTRLQKYVPVIIQFFDEDVTVRMMKIPTSGASVPMKFRRTRRAIVFDKKLMVCITTNPMVGTSVSYVIV